MPPPQRRPTSIAPLQSRCRAWPRWPNFWRHRIQKAHLINYTRFQDRQVQNMRSDETAGAVDGQITQFSASGLSPSCGDSATRRPQQQAMRPRPRCLLTWKFCLSRIHAVEPRICTDFTDGHRAITTVSPNGEISAESLLFPSSYDISAIRDIRGQIPLNCRGLVKPRPGAETRRRK